MADLCHHAGVLLIHQHDVTVYNYILFGLLQLGTQKPIWRFLNADSGSLGLQYQSEELPLHSNLHSRHQLAPPHPHPHPHRNRDKRVIITQATNQTGEAEFRVYLYALP